MEYVCLHTGKDDGDTFVMGTLDEHTKVVHCGRIYKRHFTHSDDTNRIILTGHVHHNLIEAVRDTEEIRSVNLIDFYAIRNREVVEVELEIRVFVRVDLCMQGADMCLLIRTHQEED